MNTFVDMKMTEDEVLDHPTPIAIPTKDRATYPYGLRISFGDRDLKKLDADIGDFRIGDIIDIRALGRVTSISSSASEAGGCCHMEIQLEQIMVENETTEPEMAGGEKKRSPLYDRDDDDD